MGKYKKSIQKNITVFREKKGMTKADLARACGVSKPTVTNWENGRNSLDADMLFKVAGILDVSADVLAGRIPAGFTYEEPVLLALSRSVDAAFWLRVCWRCVFWPRTCLL